MLIISAREFRANQKKYFEMAETETILIARSKKKPIALVIANEEEILSKKEIEAINNGLKDIKQGKTIKIENPSDIWANIL